ncbi:hypothetical protein TRM7557_01877 [Tritonibacter multivorans]|uniref:TonB C-terminal domain-containing protein n=1 Tax=Tritonibacter multivorans TaxID=928856 RepID=A0A0P1GSI6_9RHOB|nr:TonB family protein [Tritonibacter multivorans]MDA7422118.1 TonB family protein [Tritonibacter multivorans]CUH78431.1 hypothetical protein TRM7557_01877 [Tritonibacter multivorans]SFD16760.1 TonB family C-terminal domain-containing protein [Tritonibacter multivorans]
MKLSQVLFVVGLCASTCVHLGVLRFAEPAPVETAGGAISGSVAIGSSFANLVAGQIEATTGDQSFATRLKPLVTHSPMSAPAVVPDISKLVEPAKIDAVKSAPLVKTVATVAASKVLKPVPEQPQKQVQPAETVRKAARGNAQQSAAAGQTSGVAKGTKASTNAAQKTTAQDVGQKAISSYQGKVLKKIRRAAQRTRSDGVEGTAVVGLHIAANGSIAGLRLVRPSGDPGLDKTAQKAVRKAAPFDPTPNRAPMKVNVLVKISG